MFQITSVYCPANLRCLLLCVATLCILVCLDARAQDTRRPPNIIFILADDLGYGDLGVYGQQKIQTPHIDELAAEGIRFTNAYAGHSVCAPSRSVLMTGQHTGHTRVRGNHGENAPAHDGQKGRIPLAADDVTVAELLKRAGYATGIAGKWGLGEPGSTGLPNDHGFDELLGYLNQDHAPFYYTDYLWRNKGRQEIPENADGASAVYSCDLFTDFAESFIREHHQEPFFLYLPYTIPHFNMEVPELGEYADKPWSEDEKILAAMITRLDSYVGRIVALVDELNLAANTAIFFASDNGASANSLEFFERSGALRAAKGALYDGGLRTPAILRWPGTAPAGTVSDAVWYFADFLPTACAMAGVSPPDNVDGTNVLPSLLGGSQPALERRFLYWESHEGHAMGQAVRWGRWKGVRYGQDEPLELYDLHADPGEASNVAMENTEVILALENYLDGARTESRYWPVDRGKRLRNRFESPES